LCDIDITPDLGISDLHTLNPKSHPYLYVIQIVTYSISLGVSYWYICYWGI